MALNMVSAPHSSDLLCLYRASKSIPRSSFPSAKDGTCLSSSSLSSSSSSLSSRRYSRSVQCAAVTGGSKRDVEKLVAKTQHLRPRHRKGMTPSKSDLIEALEEEEAIEEDVENEITELVGETDLPSSDDVVTDSATESVDANDELNSEPTLSKPNEGDDENTVDYNLNRENAVDDATKDAKELVNSTENMVTDVVDRAVEGQKDAISNAARGVRNVVDSANSSVQGGDNANDAINRPSSDMFTQANTSTEAVASEAMDTAADVGNMIDETGQQLRVDMSEAASSIGDALDSQANSAYLDMRGQASEVEASMRAVADVAADTTEFVSEKVSSTGEHLRQDLGDVVSSGQSLVDDASKAVGEQGRKFQSQAERFMEKEGGLLEQQGERIRSQASKSLDRVQDSVRKVVQESANAARSIGQEAYGMGELIMDTAKETIQATSSNTSNITGAGSVERANVSLTPGAKSQELQEEHKDRFTGFKVMVAGASGRTGRLIAENLASKGVPVRAMVRDTYKARSIHELKDCEFFEADLYKYETVRKALGDCNVVICAIGARAFPLDPFYTYQVEYEGVLNLIAAAKNQGKIKKFILVSTIGVTYFQLVPLIFWKKQAELYLQRSGLDYTIVRPGGLRNTNEGEEVVMQAADSQFFGGISRAKVAEICVSAIVSPDASGKVVEVVTVPGRQRRSIDDLFKLV